MRSLFLLLFFFVFSFDSTGKGVEGKVRERLYHYCSDTTFRDTKIIRDLIQNKSDFSNSTSSLLEYTLLLIKSRENTDQLGDEYRLEDYSITLIKMLKILEQWELDNDIENINFGYGNIAQTLYQLEVYDYAIIYLKRKMRLNRPDDQFVEDVYMLANSYLKVDREVQNTITTINRHLVNIEEFTAAEKKDSVLFEFNKLLIEANYKKKQYVEALSLLEKNIRYFTLKLSLSKKIEAYTDLAELKHKRDQEVHYLFEILMKNYGKDLSSQLTIREAEMLFNFNHGIYEETPDSVIEYINSHSYDDRGYNYLLVLKQTGDLEFKNKKYNKAYREYKELLNEFENSLHGTIKLEVFGNIGYSAQEIGKNKEAAEYFKSYIDYKSKLDEIEAQRAKNIQDIIYYFRNAKNMVEADSKRSTLATIGRQQSSLERAESYKLLLEEKARYRRYYNYGLILIISVVVGFLAFYIRSNIKNRRLLRNILPEKIAKQLKSKRRFGRLKKNRSYTITDEYKMATVLFTDFKGFTSIAEKLTPEELVEELNLCFASFDRISKKNRLEKIKTIGDAYMAAGGIPEANETNPEDAVNAALEMIEFIKEFNAERRAENMPEWKIRIGINTGHIVAGIIGRHKYSYDVWGDAVNLASRMESSGEPGKINISENTYELIKDKFECSYRGEIEAKNKGKVKMYFVEKRK